MLRHQQKLHASLSTNTRPKASKKNAKQSELVDNEPIADYLNGNINIVKNNTDASLPLPRRGDTSSDSDGINENGTGFKEDMFDATQLPPFPIYEPEAFFPSHRNSQGDISPHLMAPSLSAHSSEQGQTRHNSFSAASGTSYACQPQRFHPDEKLPTPFEKHDQLASDVPFDMGSTPSWMDDFVDESGGQAPNWITDFINTPYNADFPTASDYIGFTDSRTSPHGSSTSTANTSATPPSGMNDLNSLFRSRQVHLFKQIAAMDPSTIQQVHRPIFTIGLRNHILNVNNLSTSQFPEVEDLNTYLSLYELEFDMYFPFVHLGSLDGSVEQIPLLLSMCAIGALYSFHARNSSILYNLARFLIHNYMEQHISSSSNLHKVPLYVPQSLVLHMFLGMFNNDQDMNKLAARQLHSVVGLVKATQLNLPLSEVAGSPPVSLENNGDTYNYFVVCQSRIRTVHALYYLSVLFASLIGSPVALQAHDIKCGAPCHLEYLWRSSSADQWNQLVAQNNLDPASLVMLSNGDFSFDEIWSDVESLYCDKKLNFKTLLSLLMAINETIHVERRKFNVEANSSSRAARWRMNSRSRIESLIKSWEMTFVRNGGVLVVKESNLHIIQQTPVLRLILPLLNWAKIRKCVQLTPILENIWFKNWDGMNLGLKNLDNDPEALREATSYSVDIIELWIDMISIVQDAEKTSVRTPIFFLTCIFSAVLVIAEYLYVTEKWAQAYLEQRSISSLSTTDRVAWLKTERILKKVENKLIPKGFNNSSYSEFLRLQANGALDVEILDDEIAQLTLEPNIDLKHTAEIISSARLSLRCLSLGVRILADAPVWPVALVFAEALKSRAIYISQSHSPR